MVAWAGKNATAGERLQLRSLAHRIWAALGHSSTEPLQARGPGRFFVAGWPASRAACMPREPFRFDAARDRLRTQTRGKPPYFQGLTWHFFFLPVSDPLSQGCQVPQPRLRAPGGRSRGVRGFRGFV